ncbi:MFS transporter [Deinococcus deserti]|uniref:Putative major facilitator superfamily MFS_1 putative membrane protein n=1 Tax=Deinococcus deserti (strain DSM 17065 / CIP 109153 / LMG 22923 / VCD115) TaxID=546414 RepID=C1D290_DEIDV|nr:MFS transporter [Deinococcus deserti]ACO47529.1 putative major facilitator superfamily MFS_1; putative membrane protein [Deinococcus deserti VCD115]
MTTPAASPDAFAALRFADFRRLLVSSASASFAGTAFSVVIGYQVYALTKSPLILGLLGVATALPTLSLALLGGHYADRLDRRRILLVTRALLVLSGLAFAGLSLAGPATSVTGLFLLVVLMGFARGFGDPASSAFETRIVPARVYVNASAWLGSVGQVAGILGPVLAGLFLTRFEASGTYMLMATLYATSWFALRRMPRIPPVMTVSEEGMRESIQGGLRFVRKDPVLFGSMALDLLAVLFGGAVALLPVFASDILKVSPSGLGMLMAAPSVGALLVMLWMTRKPPLHRTGVWLVLSIAGFGLAMLVFGVSRTFWLSWTALAFSGVFDGVNMLIRRAIVRTRTPDHMRGRVGSVSLVFIGTSNEIGALESGVAAHYLGVVRATALGGLITLAIAGGAAWRWRDLMAWELRHEQAYHSDTSGVDST